MTIDVVIPTWNGVELLVECLEHLRRDGTPNRPIVVDNGSSDDSVEVVRRDYPEALVVELGENVGFGRAVNRGFDVAESDVVALINNDAMVRPGFLAGIIEPFADEKVGMVAGLLINPDTGLIDAAGIEVDAGLGGYLRLHGRPLGELRAPPLGMVGPCAAAAAFRRTTFTDAGGFDEELFAFCEEEELAMRLRVAGWSCELATNARADHRRSSTFGGRKPSVVAIFAESRGYVAGRYRVAWHWLAFEAAVGAVDALRLRRLAPLTGRLRGWRRGRALDRRIEPADLPKLGIVDAIRRRSAA